MFQRAARRPERAASRNAQSGDAIARPCPTYRHDPRPDRDFAGTDRALSRIVLRRPLLPGNGTMSNHTSRIWIDRMTCGGAVRLDRTGLYLPPNAGQQRIAAG